MNINIYKGLLVVFDGPNGAGKTTIIDKLYNKLMKEGYNVYKTKEPSESTLGSFVREKSEIITENALACMVAADRYEHLKKCIIPKLKNSKIVLCDRYVLSSYILQGMDGVQKKFISKINSNIILPDIQILLTAPVDIIQARLLKRTSLSRFEINNKTQDEIKHMNSGVEVLSGKGVPIYKYDTSINLNSNVNKIYNVIISYLNKKEM